MRFALVMKSWTGALVLIAVTFAARTHAQSFLPKPSVPGFSLIDMSGHTQRHSSFRGQVTAVIFFSTRCPMSNAFNFRRNELYKSYRDRVQFVILDSNANESLEEVRTYAQSAGFDFPVYLDTNNQAADALGARGTTETFVLDGEGLLRYHGPIEDSPNPERTKLQGLRSAIDSVLAGREVAVPQARALGCAIRRTHP